MIRPALTLLAIALVAVPVYLPARTSAQISIPGAETALSLALSPQYPAPDSGVTLTLQSFLFDIDSSTVTWTVNGKVIAQGDGIKTLDVKTGPIGSKLSVVADIAGPDGSASAAATVIPTSIDLLWESDSYTPPFYGGRALPSAGSRVHLVAIPHFVSANGEEIPSDRIIFTWKKDNEVLETLSGRGKSSATIEGPSLFGTETVVVDASAVDGSIAGQALVRIPDTEPLLTLYENHPLFGVLYHRALDASAFVPENEVSFTAVPYFVSAASQNDASLQYEWRVNQNLVATNPERRNEITINAASSTGLIALINLSLTHSSNYFLNAAGSWSVTFNKSGSFGPAGDVFHQ